MFTNIRQGEDIIRRELGIEKLFIDISMMLKLQFTAETQVGCRYRITVE